jgi:hypothetical protein
LLVLLPGIKQRFIGRPASEVTRTGIQPSEHAAFPVVMARKLLVSWAVELNYFLG